MNIDLHGKMTNDSSHYEECVNSERHDRMITEVYPGNSSDHTAHETNHNQKNLFNWSDDILIDQRKNGYDIKIEEVCSSSHYSGMSGDQVIETALQRHCDDNQDKLKFETTDTNLVTLSELSDLSVIDADKYAGLSDFNFSPKVEETEDLNDIWSSLKLGGIIETHLCTAEEVDQCRVEITSLPEDPIPTVNHRRARNTSRRMSVVNGDDNSFCSQSENSKSNKRKRNVSELSIVSAGSYDDPESPYNSGGPRKRRRYEEDPSEDPAFEKSRKNAIIAKRNREMKKQLLEQLESRCDKLTTANTHLGSENSKLRHRVETLEEEVFYLKSVLANQSALSGVLSTLKNVDQLRLSSSFEASKYTKKNASSSTQKNASNSQLKVPGGICLHVDGNQVSIEMCTKCAQVN